MRESLADRPLANGFFISRLELPPAILEWVVARDWNALDQAFAKETSRGGVVFEELTRFASFTQIEFTISIRSSQTEPDEDGIWHDDGSRVLAFSLSLTLDTAVLEGGVLEIRKFGESGSSRIPTPEYGTLIVFATGQQGFEHKINRVARGERLIIAGWCTP